MPLTRLPLGTAVSGDLPSDSLPSGSILQVVSGTYTAQLTSATRNAWTDLGFSKSITTKKANSKFHFFATLFSSGYTTAEDWSPHFRILRGTTVAGTTGESSGGANRILCHTGGQSVGSYDAAGSPVTVETFDEPDSIAAGTTLTYKLQYYIGRDNGNFGFNRGQTVYNDDISGGNPCSTIIIKEIAG